MLICQNNMLYFVYLEAILERAQLYVWLRVLEKKKAGMHFAIAHGVNNTRYSQNTPELHVTEFSSTQADLQGPRTVQ